MVPKELTIYKLHPCTDFKDTINLESFSHSLLHKLRAAHSWPQVILFQGARKNSIATTYRLSATCLLPVFSKNVILISTTKALAVAHLIAYI